MNKKIQWVTALAMSLLAGPAPAQDSMLDLIPSDAAAAITIRDLNELKKKGDVFLKQADIQMGLRPSQLFEEGYRYLGVKGGVDEGSPAAIVLVSPKSVGLNRKLQLEDLNRLLVVALPFQKVDTLAGNFGFRPGELKPQQMKPPKRKPDNFGKLVYVRGKHLFVGNHPDAIKHVVKNNSLGKELTPAQRKSFAKADLLVHLGGEVWQTMWKELKRDLQAQLSTIENTEERKMAQQFLQTGAAIRFATGAARIDNGFSLSVATVFDRKNNPSVQQFFDLLRSGDGTSGLDALPAGDLFLGQSVKGSGAATAVFAKLFFDQTLRHWLQTQEIISPLERPLWVGVFNEVWQHLQGYRVGVYLNAEQHRHGLFSFVGVLETKDAKKFLKEMQVLAKIADGTGLKIAPSGNAKGEVNIEKLIKDLGSDSYRQRELATLKLRLLGEPALPYLDKASESKDPEVAKRASRLHQQIAQLAAQRRKDLFSEDPFKQVRPTFALVPNVEQLNGSTVDVLRIKIPKNAIDVRKQMTQFLGPEWENIRLVVHGKQLIVLLGSDTSLLATTLKNLDGKKPGITASKQLATFYKQSQTGSRKFELHVSVAKLLKVMDPAATIPEVPGKTEPAVSSIGVSVDPQRIQLDLWVPIQELRLVAKSWGW